jgi:hypothetical protein
VTVKSPIAAVATLVAVAVPVFEIVNTAGELVVPTVWFPKLIVVLASTIVGVPTNPVQEIFAVSGLLAAFDAKLTIAVRDPAAVGAQFTVAVQEAPGITVTQLFSEMVKSPGFVPPSVTPERARSAFPVFLAVIVWAADVVPVWMLGGEKLRLVGVKLTAGAGTATPLVVSGRSCGLLAASSIKWRFAARFPVPLGVAVISTVQTLPGASVLPQLLVIA